MQSHEAKECVFTGSPLEISCLKASIRSLIGDVPLHDCLRFDAENVSGPVVDLPAGVRDIIHFIYPDLPRDAPIAAFAGQPGLRLDLWAAANNATVPSRSDFVDGPVVRTPIASFMREVFCLSVDGRSRRCADIQDESPVYVMYLPIPIPVVFQTVDEKDVRILFGPVPGVEAEAAAKLLDTAVEAVQAKQILVASYKDVDILGLERDVQESLEKRLECYLIKSRDTYADEARSFVLYALPKSGTVEQKLIDGLERLFHGIELRQCTGCHRLLSDQSVSEPCVERVNAHVGQMIPFENGETKRIDDRLMKVVVKWSCCGELPEDAPGCVEIPKGNVHVLEGLSEVSRWEHQVVAGASI